ncbi:serine/threonine-protein phosphatase 6 regulatory subunit 1 [Fagus crenata]
MGALAPVTTWNPEDDLLLKNAVEAGASLESLAKGAVQFSRRYTVRELQDRWHSLLYDPVISAEASAHMIVIEHSASTLPSKSNRIGNSKENKSVSGKRKVESVRNCYYALRKRICNEPFNSMDLSFLVAPGNCNYIGNENEPLPGDCMPGEPMSNHFGLEGSNLDIMHHVFPQNLMDGGAATDTAANGHAFHPGLQHPGVEDFCIEQGNIHNEIPPFFGENLPFTGNGSGVEEYGQPGQLPAHSLLEANDLGVEPSSTFVQINNDPEHICTEFEGNQVYNSPMSECGGSFQNLEFSSPLGMSIWRTVEGLAEPSMSVDVGLGENDLHTGDRFELPDDDDAKNVTTSGYDVPLDSKLEGEMTCDGLRSPTASTEGYLAELSNSLLNFNEEELFFMDVDGKEEVIDKSYFDGLSSLLLNSPNDVSQNHTSSITEPETSVPPDTDIKNPSIVCSEELEENRGSHYDDGYIAQDSGAQMLSSLSASNPQFPDLSERLICCTLNTEDPEIPCNDDFIPPKQLSPSSVSFVVQQNFQEANPLTSLTVNDISGNQRTRERGLVLMKREGKNPRECHVSSKKVGSHVLPELSVNHPIGDSGVKFELPNNDPPHVASKGAGISYGGSDQINAASLSTDALKEETKEVTPVQHLSHNHMDSFIKRPALGCDSLKGCTQTSGIKQELEVPATIQDYQLTHADMGSVDTAMSEPVVKPTIADQEEAPVESDDDVPYYSDIEAMILDMDLDPEDQDLYSSEEVSRYQHEDTKRAIIRLEQGAHSYMQRDIASHGAFAILYGRYSKHYIKKPEVLLGRATEDMIVDIDLGREGRTNKISRRQAIIKMDKGGSFYLKNLGKCPILVNNKEVGPGQSLSLISSCLIEIRGMPFVFETNQTHVKQYLDNITKNNQMEEHQL